MKKKEHAIGRGMGRGTQQLSLSPGTEGSWISVPRSPGIRPTPVFETFWRFAAARQEIFFARYEGSPPPWTGDPILRRYKFTNAYRASDRVSQFLIRNVIYTGDQSPDEVFFRVVLFKLFNRIETWKLLESKLDTVRWDQFSLEVYDRILTEALERGEKVYSAAYIMPPLRGAGARRKHRGHLMLLERMMRDDLPWRIADSRSLRHVFELLQGFPMMGDFLAYQYTIDVNYAPFLEHSESEFVVPGPGARRGISKCFSDLGGLSEVDVIRMVMDSQEREFRRLGLRFRSLWGRPLQLIDCQNLFCEVDKYARAAHPEVTGRGGGKRIKQMFRAGAERIEYWYPPKWHINELIGKSTEA